MLLSPAPLASVAADEDFMGVAVSDDGDVMQRTVMEVGGWNESVQYDVRVKDARKEARRWRR